MCLISGQKEKKTAKFVLCLWGHNWYLCKPLGWLRELNISFKTIRKLLGLVGNKYHWTVYATLHLSEFWQHGLSNDVVGTMTSWALSVIRVGPIRNFLSSWVQLIKVEFIVLHFLSVQTQRFFKDNNDPDYTSLRGVIEG